MAVPTEPRSSSPPGSALHLVLRLAAMGIGLPLCIAAGTAWIGLLTESVWIALGVASAIALIPPLVLVNRLLPDDVQRGRGIPTDVLSLVWLGLAALAFGPLAGVLHDPLVGLAARVVGPSSAATLVAEYLTAGAPAAASDAPDD
nr:hypothetical protein [Myxococcota bacterium]